KGLDDTMGRTTEGFDGADLLGFIADRLKVHLREKGVRHDHIDAVFSSGAEDDLVRLLARVNELAGFLNTEDGGHLLTAYKRAANIVRIEEKNDGNTYDGEYRVDLLTQEEEKNLAAYLDEAVSGAKEALGIEDFTAALTAIAGLRKPVDKFFDTVTVNAEDAELRVNRLCLLSRIGATLDQVADFSKIEGGER
ncbi:MAG: DALR anticodon-binding domain-containing protein, partial [Alphaproteobacteria bacterium]|nr:DALR anticodon-binding domain-containing protein [Alphaproteobacteria bacterium]